MDGTTVIGFKDGLPANILIPDGVKKIGYRAFSYCELLTSVTISASVTEIAERAFDWCDSLTDVYYGGTEAQ